MEARNDQHIALDEPVVETEWKSPEQDPACVSVNHGRGFGMGNSRLKSRLHFAQEVVAQPLALPFVPAVRALHVGRCGSPKDRRLQPRDRICLTTSSQGTPTLAP